MRPHLALSIALLALPGCLDATGVTVHNGTDLPLTVSGGPDGDFAVAPDDFVRLGKVRSRLELTAKTEDGQTYGPRVVELAIPGAESVWAVGGRGCFAEGDFSPYYGEAIVGMGAQLVGLMKQGEEFYVTTGPVAAGPGRRLPGRVRGGRVTALVRIPCKAAVNEAVARGWLEITLPEIEPK